jgi:hypothetical protein
MPADQPNIGMGRRRQGYTGPDRTDDSNNRLDRAIDEERTDPGTEDYDRGKAAGASGAGTPHDDIKPGTRRRLEEAGLGGTAPGADSDAGTAVDADSADTTSQ